MGQVCRRFKSRVVKNSFFITQWEGKLGRDIPNFNNCYLKSVLNSLNWLIASQVLRQLILLPPDEPDEDLFPCLDRLDAVDCHAEEAGLGLADIVALLNDNAARGWKRKKYRI
jgi:hypothetical protein